MTYQYMDYGDTLDPEEERKKRLAQLAQANKPDESIADKFGNIKQAYDSAQQFFGLPTSTPQAQQLAPTTPAPQPAPEQPQQVQQPAVPEQLQQQEQQPTQQVSQPVSPEQIELPQPGPGVQVAGASKGLPQLSPGASQQLSQQLGSQGQANDLGTGVGLKNPHQSYVDQFNSGDLYSLASKNSGAPDYIRTAAQEQIVNDYKEAKDSKAGQQRVNDAVANVSSDPSKIMKLFDDFKRSKSEDGNWGWIYLLKRLGFDEAANDELAKKGYGAKFEHIVLSDGTQAMVKMTPRGEPISGISESGEKLTPEQLIGAGSMKGAATSPTVGHDSQGHVINKITVPGQPIRFYDATEKKYLDKAPEGYYEGRDQNRALADQAYARSKQNDEAKNRANVAKGLKPEYNTEQMEERASAARTSILGLNQPSAAAAPGNVPAAGATGGAGQTAADWAKANGIPISNQGGTRTTQEQANQMAQWYQNGMKGPKPAEPGSSKHETGDAIDVPKEGRTQENLKKLKDAGFVNNVPGDPWHFERKQPAAQVGAGAPSISQVQKSNAERIANYDAPPLTGSGMGGQNAITMAEVYKINPNYDGTKFKAMQKTRQDFATGPQGKVVTAMNTAVAHLDTLNEAGTALYQGQIPMANKIVREFSNQLGLPQYTNFEGIKHIVGTEVAKAVSGSGQTALADRQAIEKEFDSANSSDQLKGIIKKYQELMGGQLKSQKQNWTSSGLNPDEFDKKLLSRTKKVINETEAPTRSKW